MQEVRVHWALEECDGILRLLELYEDALFVFLVLEYQAEGSLLAKEVAHLEESQVKLIIEQLLLTLDFIHQKGVIHRDIKVDNILVHKIEDGAHYDVKIADFGLATFTSKLPNALIFFKCGTPGYVAPEMLRGQGYTNKADLFSMGSVLYRLLSGRALFKAKDSNDRLKMNKRCDISKEIV